MEREQLVGPRFGDEQLNVYALAVSGSTLYAGGDFTTAGGSAANNIAQWNGSSWSALGSGIRWQPHTARCALRWRCRAARCMRAAISRRRAAARPITSRNGTGAVGRPSVRGFGDELRLCACAGGVGQHVVCGRRFHDGGRQRGQLHRAMEREQLVGPRFGDGWQLTFCVCAGGVGQHVVCGRQFHDGGRQRGQLHRAMEREQLVGPRFGDEQRMCLRWRCRAARCMRAAISRRRAAARPITSRNGTGAVGRPSVRG